MPGDGGAITITGSNAATITVDGLITSTGGANTGTGKSGAGGAITFETAGVNLINLESTTITSAGGSNNDPGAADVKAGGKVWLKSKVMLIGGASAINTGTLTAGEIHFDSTLDGVESK